jgi:hypothetical protein
MRISRLAFCLLGLTCCGFAGCSARAWGVRSSSPPKTQTVASVGDKPLPIVAGEPGSLLSPETEELDLPASSGSRISGRVFDGSGKAVPNAKVRLGVDGAPGGRAKSVMTDRSGGTDGGGHHRARRGRASPGRRPLRRSPGRGPGPAG